MEMAGVATRGPVQMLIGGAGHVAMTDGAVGLTPGQQGTTVSIAGSGDYQHQGVLQQMAAGSRAGQAATRATATAGCHLTF